MTATAQAGGPAAAPSDAWLGELGATLRLAWPLVLANLVQTGMTTTDIVLLGRLGPDAIAAAALATSLYFGCFIFGIGIVTAVSPLVAEELGRNRHAVREVRRTVRQGLWVALSVSAPIWLVLWHGEWILLRFGQRPELAATAGSYLRALQWALLPSLGFVVLRHFIAALQRPGWALAVGLVGLPLNAVIAWALIFGHGGLPALGPTGAGVATTLVSFAGLALLALVIVRDRHFRRYRLFGRVWRADWPRYRALWRLGLPIGAILVFEVTIFNGAAFLMGLIGSAELAAHTVALQISALAFMVPLGLGQAATVRVGRAFGAGDADAVGRAGWTAFALSLAFALVMAAAFFLAPRLFLAGFFDLADPANERVVAFAAGFLLFSAMFQVFDGGQAVGSGMLRGLQDTRVPMLIAAVGYWLVGAPVAVWFGFYTPWRGQGIWLGLTVGLAVTALLLLLRWAWRERLGLVRRERAAGM